jgi:hypothetical protein
MIQAKSSWKAAVCVISLVSSWASSTLLLDPAQIFRERQPFMVPNAAADEAQPGKKNQSVPLARDANIAVKEEYEAARRQQTVQALELFIARHPDDPLAEKARADLQRLVK